MPNGKCRMHGGASRGAEGKANGAYRHGGFQEAVARRRKLGALIRMLGKAAQEVT